MNRIVVPYLMFENQKIKSPIGLSELLESAWSEPKHDYTAHEVVSSYRREVYKNEVGKWATKFEMR